MMRKQHFLLIALVSMLMMATSAGSVSAKELTSSQALSRFLGGTSDKHAVARIRGAQSANKLELAFTSQYGDTKTYYVFNNVQQGGYVILSANDLMPAVLGIVDEGKFDMNKIPDNMKWYLNLLNANIKKQVAAGKQVGMISQAAIAPLLGKTEWDQGTPYNNEVPSYNGVHSAVGCVATATAQIMRYHQYPTQGTGSRTYKFWYDTKEGTDAKPTDSTTFSTDFSAHTYDWANMIDKYDNDPVNYNETQGKAISMLLKDIGVASSMVYGTEAAGGSGTQTYYAAAGLVDYFGYDASIQFVRHKFYTNDEWDNMIYNELANNRPVMFGGVGANNSGGHEFVGDGFQDGKFHINWGWSGSNNGYFLLTGPGLIPEGTGSGGAEAGSSYGYDLEALIYIMPNNGGTEDLCRTATVGYTAKVDGKKLTLTGQFINTSYRATRDTFAIQLQAADESCYNYTDKVCILGENEYISSIDVTIEPEGLDPGTYTIVPITKGAKDEDWAPIKIISTFKAATLTIGQDYTMTISNSSAPKIEAEGEVTINKKSFRPTKKKDDGTLDAETLVMTCEKGIKNCDTEGHKLYFGAEFYDLTKSNDTIDVYWLSTLAKTNADSLAAGASITTISIDILEELEAGHSYEVSPIFYSGIDESLDDEAFFNQLDAVAQYVTLPKDAEVPVIEIVADEVTAVTKVTTTSNAAPVIYNINGKQMTVKSISSLPKGIYIVKDSRGVRKIVKK